MAKIKTRLNCPNCRQPLVADVEQLFDVGADPAAKQRLLSGAVNHADCPYCGYSGPLSTPIVYHDPGKELLLTFFPPTMTVAKNEREQILGALINQAVNNLPKEQRKGYLFSPQAVLTLQGLIERILEADGITKEMIEAQQQRLNLIQLLMDAPEETLAETVKEKDEQVDEEFFAILSTLAQASAASGDQASAQKLADLQRKLVPLSTFGKEIEAQSKEIETAAQSLKEAGKDLTRERLLDLVIEAPNETRLSALVSLARPGMDYQFFQTLTQRIDGAGGEEKQKLEDLRAKLLEMTSAIDRQVEARLAQAHKNLETLLKAKDIAEATRQHLGAIDDFFLEALNAQYDTAAKKNDSEKIEKLNQVVKVVQEASVPGGALLQELLEAPDEAARKQILEAHREQITPEFVETLTNLLVQLEGGKDVETKEKVRAIYRTALRMSMQTSMKGE